MAVDEPLIEQEIRAEMGEILDQLHRLQGHEFAQRTKLRDRQEELGRMLREIEIPDAEEIERRWSEAAGSKADENETQPVIVSPGESGSSGGA